MEKLRKAYVLDNKFNQKSYVLDMILTYTQTKFSLKVEEFRLLHSLHF